MFLGQRQGSGRQKEAAIETEKLPDEPELLPVVHGLPEKLDVGPELLRMGDPDLVQAVTEELLRKESDILGEHREDAAHEEFRDALWRVAGAFEVAGERGKVRRNFARHLCGT